MRPDMIRIPLQAFIMPCDVGSLQASQGILVFNRTNDEEPGRRRGRKETERQGMM